MPVKKQSRPEPAKKLAKYQSMRDFSQTAEPSGAKPVAAGKRLRFVIQKHAATRLHYDFRLELDGVFRSWAVTRGPSLDPAEKRLAVKTIPSITAISKAQFPRASMAAAPCCCGTGVSGRRTAIPKKCCPRAT